MATIVVDGQVGLGGGDEMTPAPTRFVEARRHGVTPADVEPVVAASDPGAQDVLPSLNRAPGVRAHLCARRRCR
jgi:hypothetical protein